MTADYQSFLNQFEERKRDHIRLALQTENQAIGFSGLDELQLEHEAIPDMDFTEIDLGTSVFGHERPHPFFVSSMTAGHEHALALNAVIAEAAMQRQWLMGVGSQRRQLTDANAQQEWIDIRQHFPRVQLMGNIGLSQVITTPLPQLQHLVDSVHAIALNVHTNPLQECLQKEGTPQFKGAYAALEKLCKHLPVPIIVKETGCGFSAKTLARLKNLGVSAVDVSGLGGTHWGRIEGHRASSQDLRKQAAQTFKNWGISTVEAMLNAQDLEPDYVLFASGGVRSGLDAAKLLCLGAQMIGIAKPILAAAQEGLDALLTTMELFEFELKIALFCTGFKTISAFKAECPLKGNWNAQSRNRIAF